MTILILGGTAEARQLAAALVADGVDVIFARWTGRHACLPPGRVRVGGFGGADGLADYLRREHASAVVDATHPFAAKITKNVCRRRAYGTPLVRLERPGWAGTRTPIRGPGCSPQRHEPLPSQPAGRSSPRDGSRCQILPWADRDVLVRLVDPPATSVPQRWKVILSRGPYSYDDEHTILTEHAIDVTSPRTRAVLIQSPNWTPRTTSASRW